MESEIYQVRKVSVKELRQEMKYFVVPFLNDTDFKWLKERIRLHGLDPAQPIVVNDRLEVLDGHARLTIARELGMEWVWIMVRKFENLFEEQEYIIIANLNRRRHGYRHHLNIKQRVELAVKLEEIRQKKVQVPSPDALTIH